jgi:hypothetical protein
LLGGPASGRRIGLRDDCLEVVLPDLSSLVYVEDQARPQAFITYHRYL